jgi:ferredoxin
MPTLTTNGESRDFDSTKRLVLAIEELDVHIGHRCGGNAKCTTCRVEFSEGEPETYTRAEYNKLKERGLLGQYRLSCQHTLSHDMSVRPIMTLESEGWSDTGPVPDEAVQPAAEWFTLEELEAEASE